MFGIDDIIGAGLKIIDKFIPDPAEKLKAQQELQRMSHEEWVTLIGADTQLANAQIDVNKEQAKHASLFVSGARPAILWMCGVAFAYTYILQPFMVFIAVVLGADMHNKFPELSMEPIMAVLMTLIGARTVERVKNAHREK